MDRYIEVYTKDGEHYDFNKECNYINYSDSYFVVFMKQTKEYVTNNFCKHTQNVLMVLPKCNINRICWRDKGGILNVQKEN